MTAMGDRPPGPAHGREARQLDLPGLDDNLRLDLDERIREFEDLHSHDVMRGGEGWVPRIRRIDYLVAIAVNAIIVLWLVIVLVGGE